jgi:hypothetical protein
MTFFALRNSTYKRESLLFWQISNGKHVVLGVKQEGGSFIIYPYQSILYTIPPSTISFSNQIKGARRQSIDRVRERQ